ncbi:MAG: alpha/beta fold hydrolase [Myxococcota bacterium]
MALGRGADNALELVARGRLGAPYRARHEIVHEEGILSLRRYTPEEERPGRVGDPLLLVPPLMVTAEIYDISPELSAVSFLVGQGLDVWVVDFGAPEEDEAGMGRTLDDHVLAVDAAIEEIHRRTGRAVHLVGYSQGGMFAYQAAAYRQSEGLASVITCGSPVDMRRNLPVRLHDTLAERVLAVARQAVDGVIRDLEGLPGTLTSRGFKLLAPRQELKQLVGMLGLLHDREALERREPKRRFLGGEGFIAWSGPAFRSFVDQFVVENRMRSGGFVIAGRTASLADIDVPILYFVGSRDDLARPGSVRAICDAAPRAECHEVDVPAGHFGLVVGSRAMGETWPAVADWVRWHAGEGARPEILDATPEEPLEMPEDLPEPAGRGTVVGRLYELATDVADGLWSRMGDVSVEATGLVAAMRWQLPRLARLLSLTDHSRISMARILAEQAEAIPEETFFLWEGRAYTWDQANRRVNQAARVLAGQDVAPGHHVGIYMGNHPDFLTVVAALSRLGAVAVPINSEAPGRTLAHALEAGHVDALVTDPARADRAARVVGERPLLVIGAAEVQRVPPEGAVDLDRLVARASADPIIERPADPGRGGDLAMLLFTSGTTGLPKAVRVTNRRQVSAALWAATACELTPTNTVYCSLPLHHATGMLVAVGAALVGGSRLALAPRFSASRFWDDVRRYGADVVFYVGELCRYLVNAPARPDERSHPVEMFVGNGMRPEVWIAMQERFGPLRIVEFYGSTEGNVVLANLTGDKPGSVGRPFTGAGEVELIRYDMDADRLARGDDGRPIRCEPGEPGVLIARVEEEHPLARFDGYADPEETERRILRDVFEPGDAWFVTWDLLRRDEEGDFWFVDRLGDTYRWKGENVSTAQVASVVSEAPFVAAATVYGVELPGREGRAGMAAVELEEGERFDGEAMFGLVTRHLTPAARPRFLRVVKRLDVTDTLKFVKTDLQEDGADPGRFGDPLYWYDEASRAYRPLDMDTWAALTTG